jgi:hypothetical protein
VGILARPKGVGRTGLAWAVLAGAREAAGTQQTAWERCDIVVAAHSFESLAQTQCKAKCYRRPRGSGTRIGVAFVEGGTQAVAAEFVVLAGRRSKVPGCKVIAAVLHVVAGESGRDQDIVRAIVAQGPSTGTEVLSTTTGSSRREVRCKGG